MTGPPREILEAIARMRPAQRADAIATLREWIAEGRPLAAISVLVDQDGRPVALVLDEIGSR